MTTAGNAKVFTLAVTNTVIDMATEFKVINSGGQMVSKHSGYWLINKSVTAAEVIWFRMDSTPTSPNPATVDGPDCWPLRSGERVLIPICNRIDAISESGTPKLIITGDMNSTLLYA